MPKPRRVPTRMCVACGQMRSKRELIRVVRTPAGEMKVDPTGKLSGRGAYVCPRTTCAETAVTERRLEHALEQPVPAPLVQDLRRAIETVVAAAAGYDRPRVIGPIPLERLERRSGR